MVRSIQIMWFLQAMTRYWEREKAIECMKRALNDRVITGVPTTIDYRKLILDIKDSRTGKIDTSFIPKHEKELAAAKLFDLKLTSNGSLGDEDTW